MTVVFEGLTVLGMDSFCDQLGMPFSNHCSSLALFQVSVFFLDGRGQWGFAPFDPTLAVWWMCNLAGAWRIVAQPFGLPAHGLRPEVSLLRWQSPCLTCVSGKM